MKIEIELLSSVDAEIRIAGRTLTFSTMGSRDGLGGLTEDERTGTIAGIVASRLEELLPDILQGHIPEESRADGTAWDEWEQLSQAVADQVYKDVNGF